MKISKYIRRQSSWSGEEKEIKNSPSHLLARCFHFCFRLFEAVFALIEGFGTCSFPPAQSCPASSSSGFSLDFSIANLGGCLRARHRFDFKWSGRLELLLAFVGEPVLGTRIFLRWSEK